MRTSNFPGNIGFNLLAGPVMLMICLAAGAETVEPDEGGWVTYNPPVVIPLWIQDPWTGKNTLTQVGEPDTSLWNAKRITDYEESLEVDSAPPLGILTIDKLDIRVPIYNGTSELSLNKGAGRIKGMARMDEDGNLGISGHRDGYFRVLKDIQVGDEIEVQSTTGVQAYQVSSIDIVPKSDVSVLVKSDEKMLTLVTCYPFYFVGNAPKRYIVKASATDFRPEAAEE